MLRFRVVRQRPISEARYFGHERLSNRYQKAESAVKKGQRCIQTLLAKETDKPIIHECVGQAFKEPIPHSNDVPAISIDWLQTLLEPKAARPADRPAFTCSTVAVLCKSQDLAIFMNCEIFLLVNCDHWSHCKFKLSMTNDEDVKTKCFVLFG